MGEGDEEGVAEGHVPSMYERLYVRQYMCKDSHMLPIRGVNTAASVSGVGKPNMVMRSLRVPLDLWNEARAKADDEDKNISDVVRDLLAEWVKK